MSAYDPKRTLATFAGQPLVPKCCAIAPNPLVKIPETIFFTSSSSSPIGSNIADHSTIAVIEPAEEPQQIVHPLIEALFGGFDGTGYRLRQRAN